MLAEQDAHHIANVLRLTIGDKISISDGIDKVYTVELAEVGKDRVVGKILDIKTAAAPAILLTVFQGLPKAKKMDQIVEKLTEIGVARVVPVQMARSVAEYDGARRAKKLARWRAIAVEAAKQSRRVTLPSVEDIVSLKDALDAMKGFGKVIVPWEEEAESGQRIIDVIPNKNPIVTPNECEGSYDILRHTVPRDDKNEKTPHDDANYKIALVIGPEGGIEKAEVDALMEKGAKVVSLGKTILKTETAGLAAAALILLGSRE